MDKAALQEVIEEENSVSLNIQCMGLGRQVEYDKKSCYWKKSGNDYSPLEDAQERHNFYKKMS